MISPLAFLVVALATYRLARIPTKDTISEPLRDKLHAWAWDDEHPKRGPDGELYATPRGGLRTWIDGLLTCPLCFGVWTAAVVYVLWRWSDSDAVRSGLVVMAIAGAQCFLASRQDA